VASSLRLICLDLDDTLWPAKPVLERADALFYGFLNTEAPALTARLTQQALREERLAYLKENPELAHYISRWRIESLKHSLAHSGYKQRECDEIAHAAFELFIKARQEVTLFPGVEDALAELSCHYQLISLTNGNADLRNMPISQYVSHSLRAEEVGASKPAPHLFEKALSLADCRPEEVLHIGDHPVDDIEGASALGMHSLQARLPGGRYERHPQAWEEFEDWSDVTDIIRSLENR
jgi:FMN hydrolase / 5-amino-6-(5-phospho-D-ribitylamino)uracil phosphatase